MRLIDADKLLEKLFTIKHSDGTLELAVKREDIENAPTIDAIHAHLVARKDDLGYTFHCSNCNTRIYTYSKYCYVCGARMDEPDEIEE